MVTSVLLKALGREIAAGVTGAAACFALVIAVFATPDVGYAQDNYQKEIARLQSSIVQLEGALADQAEQETRALERIELLDKKISLTKKLISRLKQGIARQRSRVDSLEAELKGNRSALQAQKKSLARRIVNLYKRGRFTAVDILLGAHSLNQILVWARYQTRLAEHEARQIRTIRDRQEALVKIRNELTDVLEREKALLAERRREEGRLEKDRVAKHKALKSIRKNKKFYQQQIADYQSSLKEIQRLIATSEAKRTHRAEQSSASTQEGNFSEMKGRLPWPLRGEILRSYGPYTHPELKTITDNLGVDIRAEIGSAVHAVAAGRITAITWQRGRGNLVIINHGDGYYTVYTHLDEIFVQLQDDVAAGQVIGVVGEAGGYEVPRLHFQVWNGFQHLNPEEWLE